MASVVVPGLDLAPSVPSRVVTVDVIDMTEGSPASGAVVDFILPQDLHVRSDGKVLKAGTTRLTLDSSGHGEIRVPAYSTATKPDDWVILVKKSWAPHSYPIRVAPGSSKVSLASLIPPVEVTDNMSKYVVTDATATVGSPTTGGATATVNVEGGVAGFTFRFPDMATLETAMPKTLGGVGDTLLDLDTLTTLDDVGARAARNAVLVNGPTIGGDPVVTVEVLRNAANGITQRLTWTGGMAWRNTTPAQEWASWRYVISSANLLTSDTPEQVSLINGQTLLVLESCQAANDFENRADGFTQHSENYFTFIATSSLWAGLTLTQQNTEDRPSLMLWDHPGTLQDCEGLVRARFSALTETPRVGSGVALRATSRDAGYWVCLSVRTDGPNHLQIGRLDTDESPTLTQVPVSFDPLMPFYLRARAEGETLSAKAWPVGKPEPADWQVTVEDSKYAQGKVGFVKVSGIRSRWNYLSAAWDGASA